MIKIKATPGLSHVFLSATFIYVKSNNYMLYMTCFGIGRKKKIHIIWSLFC